MLIAKVMMLIGYDAYWKQGGIQASRAKRQHCIANCFSYKLYSFVSESYGYIIMFFFLNFLVS